VKAEIARRSEVLPPIPARDEITAERVKAIEQQVTRVLADLDDIDALDDWRARARAMEAYLRSPELQRPMLGAQRRIEARIGQLLGKPLKGKENELSVMTDNFPERMERVDFRILARALAGECEPDLTDDEWRKSRRALVALVRYRLGLQPVTPPFPTGSYHCIVADPPWTLDTGPDVMYGTGERGHDALTYSQMSVEAIEALPVKALAAPDAHLYLWTTNRYVEDAYRIARTWGFQPSTLLVWCKKPRGIGLGDTFRQTTEFIVFARRGHLAARRTVDRTWFDWPRRAHSVKPGGFYRLVESVTPAPYLDLFARKDRPGWAVWGAEVEHMPIAVEA
jgi:N6-adenosine-specific RNA methylase IME4